MRRIALKKIEEFESGHFEKGYQYKYFVPNSINHDWIWNDSSLSELLELASKSLGELNSFSRFVPNVDLFIHMLVTKESVTSNKIEGTQTNMKEALLPEEDVILEQKNDWLEVQNYTKALNTAIKKLVDFPLALFRFRIDIVRIGETSYNA